MAQSKRQREIAKAVAPPKRYGLGTLLFVIAVSTAGCAVLGVVLAYVLH